MSKIDNINGIYAKDTELRSGINTLRTTVLNSTIKTLNVTEAGTYTANPNTGTYGYSPVIVNIGPSLPDTYDELDYVIVPSSWTGFVVPNWITETDDVVETDTAPFSESLSGEHAFFATEGYVEGCYQDGNLTKWGNGCEDLIGTRSATANTRYTSRIKINSSGTPRTISIGYYNSSIRFFGRIYTFTVYRSIKDQSGTEVGTNKIIDLIPAKRKSDDKVGLFDMVNQVFCVSTTGTDFGEPT